MNKDQGHQHSHKGHQHSHADDIEKGLLWALIITFGIFVLEIIGGWLSNSLALMSDSGHMFGDVLALGLSFAAAKIAKLPPSSTRTYGYHRIEVLAAIFNGVTLFILAGFIFYEAYLRILKPQPVQSFLMLIVAIIGLVANIMVMRQLHSAASHNLNVRAAFLHVLGDMLGSVGVVAGGLIMMITGSFLADPIISFFVGAIILYGAFGILREGGHILLEGVPYTVNIDKLKTDMENVDGVISVHDLHVWTISSANLALSSHIKVNNQDTHASQRILSDTREMLGSRYGIHHATLQIECDCCTDSNCGCMGNRF